MRNMCGLMLKLTLQHSSVQVEKKSCSMKGFALAVMVTNRSHKTKHNGTLSSRLAHMTNQMSSLIIGALISH